MDWLSCAFHNFNDHLLKEQSYGQFSKLLFGASHNERVIFSQVITIVTLPISNSELKKPNDQREIPWERKENYSITWKTRRNLCHHFFIQVNCSQRKDTKAECLSCCLYRIFSPVTPYTINFPTDSEWHSHVNTCVCVIMHYNQGR